MRNSCCGCRDATQSKRRVECGSSRGPLVLQPCANTVIGDIADNNIWWDDFGIVDTSQTSEGALAICAVALDFCDPDLVHQPYMEELR